MSPSRKGRALVMNMHKSNGDYKKEGEYVFYKMLKDYATVIAVRDVEGFFCKKIDAVVQKMHEDDAKVCPQLKQEILYNCPFIAYELNKIPHVNSKELINKLKSNTQMSLSDKTSMLIDQYKTSESYIWLYFLECIYGCFNRPERIEENAKDYHEWLHDHR
jgi:hypothetical protein